MEEQEKESYGIAAALSEALEAAVFADSSASYKACDLIERFAYDEVNDDTDTPGPGPVTMKPESDSKENGKKELAMAKFTMRDSNGQGREISIPLLTMIPLPLLHVTEANFDIKMKVEIEDVDTTQSSSASLKTLIADSRTPIRRKIGAITKEGFSSSSSKLTGRRMVVQDKTSSTNSTTTTIDVQMNVKMEQAEIPEGIKLMLQAAANSIQSTAIELNNQQ